MLMAWITKLLPGLTLGKSSEFEFWYNEKFQTICAILFTGIDHN